MSAPLAHNLPDRTAQVHLLAQWRETMGAHTDRRLRLRTIRRYLRLPDLASTNDLTTDQCRDVAHWLTALREQPERRLAVLRKVAAELAPDPAQVAAVADRLPVAVQADTRDRALSYLERIGEAGEAGRFGAGDCANLLLSLHPEERPRDVLAEFLAQPEMEKLKAFLCPKLPWAARLSDEDRLRYEGTAVDTLAELARVAARVPVETRRRYPDLSFEWFRAAAIAQECRDGRFVAPSAEAIEKRLTAASDNRHQFPTLAAFRSWCRTGEIVPRAKADAPDLTDEALAAFRSAFYSADSVQLAWASVFGPGGAFRIGRAR